MCPILRRLRGRDVPWAGLGSPTREPKGSDVATTSALPEPASSGVPDATAAEERRLAAVRRYDILDTPPDGAFDRVAALAARVFGVPVATISIVDSDRVWFKASCGLAGVTQVGVEPGLCASAVLGSSPYVVADARTDARTVAHPLVQGDFGLQFYAAAPIVTRDGHSLGTVNVIGTEAREVTDAEMQTLTDLAAIVMDELDLRLSAMATVSRERELRLQSETDKARVETIARTLQRTLLPPHLPAVSGLDVKSHYDAASASTVGGDFYDLFALDESGERWGLFIGDVCGTGVPAAVVTSLARYSLRAAAIRRTSPDIALAELNRALLLDQSDDEPEPRFITAIYAELTRTEAGFDLCLANGGHPPALVLRADESVDSLEGTGPLLGVVPAAVYTTVRTTLRPGDTLLLYTDGITDARSHGGPRYGEDALRDFLAGRPSHSARHVIDDVRGLLASFEPAPHDDVALLAIAVR